MLQFRIGSGGGSGGVAVRGGRLGTFVSTLIDPSNLIYTAAVAVLILICLVLIVLVIREYYLQKKKK